MSDLAFPPIPQPKRPVPPPTTAPFEQRRAAVDRVNAGLSKVYGVHGFFVLDGAGEAAVDVGFPVLFVVKPAFSFGAELVEGQSPVAGAYPTISVVVLSWVTHDGLRSRYYAGARLGVVSTGFDPNQKLEVHWQMEGMALSNPSTGQSDSVDATI